MSCMLALYLHHPFFRLRDDRHGYYPFDDYCPRSGQAPVLRCFAISTTVILCAFAAAATPTDADVVHVVKQILARGMRAVLKPQVDSKDGVWRGEITFNTSAEWTMWFGNYTAFITHYAALAESAGAAYFNVGTELDATEGQAAEWRAVIAAVRGAFSGPLWYGANWSPGVTKAGRRLVG